MNFTHASIVPLIGGETIATQKVFEKRPEYILSYTPFVANDSHLLNYYNHEVPYILIDQNPEYKAPYVDVVSAVCPCAGLSSLSTTSSPDAAANDWMKITAEYVLGTIKPRVFWGENAPHFATNKGKKVREALREIGEKNGYSMSVMKTKSLVHGIPQIRIRSFYFFWKDKSAPILEYYYRPYTDIKDLLMNVKSNFQRDLINTDIPTDNNYLKYILEELEKCTLDEFRERIEQTEGVIGYIEKKTDWITVAEWMEKNGHEREAKACRRRQAKLDQNLGYMKKDLTIPKGYIGAFVGHLPALLVHPTENRYLDIREAMTIMGLPDDFELLNPKKSINHICQNVPVGTAADMATEIKEYLLGNRKSSGHRYVLQNNINQTVEEKQFPTETLLDLMETA